MSAPYGKMTHSRKAILCATALFVAALSPLANAVILLDETNNQGNYALFEDASTVGYDVMCTMQWANMSTPVPANNQISANGLFGEVDSGLYEIDSDDPTHAGFGRTPPSCMFRMPKPCPNP